MLSLALACGGLAASEVGGRVAEVERRVGPPIRVLVAARELPAGARLRRADLALRSVPERYAAPDALSDPAAVAGARSAIRLPAGATLTASQLAGDSRAGARSRRAAGGLRRGERAVDLAVTGGSGLGETAVPGTRVDVLVSTEPHEGAGRSFLALEDVELLGLRPGGQGEGPPSDRDGASGPSALATLRVTLRQAVYLTAAQNFARELRLLARPAGDDRRGVRAAVGSGSL